MHSVNADPHLVNTLVRHRIRAAEVAPRSKPEVERLAAVATCACPLPVIESPRIWFLRFDCPRCGRVYRYSREPEPAWTRER